MPVTFLGLPLHPLIVHATVVVIPAAALVVGLTSLWPRFRHWAGPLPVVLSIVGIGLVPLSTATGETLERHVARSALVEHHTRIAEGLLPWMIALAVVSVVEYVLEWRSTRGNGPSKPIARTVLAALAVIAVSGTTVQVARIGHSGAKAAWSDTNMNTSAQHAR